jgi:hypothetical protein
MMCLQRARPRFAHVGTWTITRGFERIPDPLEIGSGAAQDHRREKV